MENIFESMNSDWIFTFKKGFHRIKVQIPWQIRTEAKWLIKPTNNSVSSPSFVFDFLACKVKKSKNYSGVQTSDTFAWVESKTGKCIFSESQVNAMSKTALPLAIFRIDDVLDKPKSIKMYWDLEPGKEWLEELIPIENELYEFAPNSTLAIKSK